MDKLYLMNIFKDLKGDKDFEEFEESDLLEIIEYAMEENLDLFEI